MPLHSNKNEEQVLNYVFKENSTLDIKSNEKNINSYYAIKHHMPSAILKSKELKFNYNKSVSYILASYKNTTLFKIPNTKNSLIQLICPPDKNFVNSLDISDLKKEKTNKKYKNSKLNFWYIELTSEEVLSLSSTQWESFTSTLLNLLN